MTFRSGNDVRDPIWLAFYAIGLLLLVTPIFDLASSAWPLQPGQPQWRYGFLGLLGNNLVLPLVAAGLLALAAASLRHGLVLRVMSWLWLAGAVLLLAATGFFVLEVLELQPQVNPEASASFRAGAAIAAAKYVLASLAFLVLGVGGLRTGRRVAETGREPGRPKRRVGRGPEGGSPGSPVVGG